MGTWARRTCLAWLVAAAVPGFGDGTSGPDRTTIRTMPWGSFYFEPARLGECHLEPTLDGFRFTSGEGKVVVRGSDYIGYEASSGADVLTIRENMGDLEIRGPNVSFTFHATYGRLTLTSLVPRDTLQFDRQVNAFTITGQKGKVTVTSSYGNLRVQSPLGTTTVTNEYGKLTFSGPALTRIPYLGRGLFIPFHGIGIFVDATKLFPMSELSSWVEWEPILAP